MLLQWLTLLSTVPHLLLQLKRSHRPDDHNVLDFGKSFEKSRWNKAITTKFVEDLLKERQEDGS